MRKERLAAEQIKAAIQDRRFRMAVLYGVSVGPGDPELMTLKSIKIINACPVIAVPRTKGGRTAALTIAAQSCEMQGKTIIYIDFAMSDDPIAADKNYARAAEQLCGFLRQGQDVAFLTIGDVSVYSTFSYIAQRAEKMGFFVQYVAGVTSFCAMAAAIKQPLVQREEPLLIVPAGAAGFSEWMEAPANKVVMKCGGSMSRIKQILQTQQVYGVTDCGLASQQCYGALDEVEEDSGYFTTLFVKHQKTEGEKPEDRAQC